MGYKTNMETPEKFLFTYVRLGDIKNIFILENNFLRLNVEMLIYKDRNSYLNEARPIRETWVIHQVNFEDFAGLVSNTKQMFYAMINDAIKKQKDVDTFNKKAKEEYEALSEEEKKDKELNLDFNTYAVGFGKHYDSLEVELEDGQEALETL